jgi:hypothetical protein
VNHHKRHYEESPQCLESDIELARALLEGAPEIDRRGLPKFVRLSASTKPTEKEAREALSRVLLSISEDYPDGRSDILVALASAFTQHKRPPFPIVRPSPFQLIIKRYSQGGEEPWRDFIIARKVRNLMKAGVSYDDAAAEVTKKFKFKDPRQIKKIYGRWRRHPFMMASDKQTDDMASDS